MNNKRTYFAIIAGSVGILFVIIIAFALFENIVNKPPNTKTKTAIEKQALPKNLEGMILKQSIEGPEAIRQISRLHGTNIKISKAYIGKYEGDIKQVIIWIAESPTEDDAVSLFKIMDQKIPKSKVFINRQETEIKEQKVITVVGMGQTHYYYQKGNRNYWIAINSEEPKELMEKIINKI